MPSFAVLRPATEPAVRSSIFALLIIALPAPVASRPSPAPVSEIAQHQVGGWDETSKSALVSALAKRARHGLDRVSFLEKDSGTSEVSLRAATLRYARALTSGLVDPSTLHDPFTLAKAHADLEPAMGKALADGKLSEWLDGLAPQDEEYARLSQAYLDLRAQQGSSDPPIGGGLLKVGDADMRVLAIVEQLQLGEYLPANLTVPTLAPSEDKLPIYTQRVSTAVQALQRDYGIAADGIVGPSTLSVLNLGVDDRARSIAVALERRRWLERTPPVTRIDVNTAAAQLRYYRDGLLVDTRRVVVGKPGTETPPLHSPIYRLVANPTWTIPKSIQNGELANVDARYLRRNNMEVRGGWIVQQSGPHNALGLVKFDMHNQHAIYLHDTSTPELFKRSYRHRSHGCVRVENAPGFAVMLAEDQGISDAWREARQESDQQFVELTKPIPVRLLYHNVFVDEQGKLVFRTDPYAWNAPIAKALGFTNGVETKLRRDEIDIAP